MARKLPGVLISQALATICPAFKPNLSTLSSLISTQRRTVSSWASTGVSPQWYFSFLSNSGFRSYRYSKWMTPSWRGGGLDGEKVVYGLIGVNAAVFVAWQIDAARSFMVRHFMCSLRAIKDLRLHTLVTCTFSHVEFGHLAVNMIALYFFGRNLTRILNGNQILNLYLLGGLIGSIADALSKTRSSSRFSWWTRYDSHSLGASGAVNAITTLSICLFPRDIIYLNFFIPVPAFLLGLGFLLYDFAGFMKNEGNVSHAAHLGGITVGALYFLRLRFGRRSW